MTSNDKVLERDRPIDLERNLKHVLSDPSCDALNSGLYVGQGVHGDPPTHRWCTLIERYVRGEIACYITLGERVSEASANNLAAIEHGVLLYWPGLHFLQLFDPLKRLKEWWHTELELMYKRAYNADRAVLVGVRQFMQMPQGAFPILPCGIGLFRPDEFNGVLSNTFQKLVDATNIESFLALENGELVFCRKYWRSPRGQNDKFPDDVIERRTKVGVLGEGKGGGGRVGRNTLFLMWVSFFHCTGGVETPKRGRGTGVWVGGFFLGVFFGVRSTVFERNDFSLRHSHEF